MTLLFEKKNLIRYWFALETFGSKEVSEARKKANGILLQSGQWHPTPSFTPTSPPNPPHKYIQTHRNNYSIINARISHFQLVWRRDQRINRRTDKAHYRVKCPQLKTDQDMFIVLHLIQKFFIFKLKQVGNKKVKTENMPKLSKICAFWAKNARLGPLSLIKSGHNPLRSSLLNSTASF